MTTDLTQYEMAQFDAQEFAVIQRATMEARGLERLIDTVHRMAGDKKRGLGSSHWKMSHSEAEEALAAMANGSDEKSLSYRVRPSELLARIASARDVITALNLQAEELENQYLALGAWLRYYPCLNADGHIHASLRGCKTVRWDTDMGWATEYSGLTADEAIHGIEGRFEGLGETLCSVCFPNAPVEWCQSRRDITRAQREAEREARRVAREQAAQAKEARLQERAARAAQPRKETPQERRWAGIKAVSDKWAGDRLNDSVREEIAADIELLLELGRSERWQDVIAGWAEAVRDPENPVGWAFTQFSVYAAHAA